MARNRNIQKLKKTENEGKAGGFLFQNGYCKGKATRHGFMLFNPNDYIGKILDQYGEWTYPEIDLLSRLIKPGSVILDIGANIGTHTLSFAKLVSKDGFVIAFEPQRIAFEFLCSNILINNLLNVLPIHAAISDQIGQMRIPVIDPNSPSNSGALKISGFTQGDNVRVVTIDSLDIDRCNLIKVDVEGMEDQVLAGAAKTIGKYRPILFVENNGYSNSQLLIRKILEFKYQCWWFFTPDIVNNGSFNPEINDKNILCLPSEWNQRMNGLEPVLDEEDTGVKAFKRLVESIKQS